MLNERMADPEREEYLIRIKREIQVCLDEGKTEGFKFLINDKLPLFSMKHSFGPVIDNNTLKKIEKIVGLIDSFGVEVKKFEEKNTANQVSFLPSAIEYLRKLNEIVMNCKSSANTSSFVDAAIIEMVLQLLEFHVGDSSCNLKNWRCSQVANKRYAKMRPRFLHDVLIEMKMCVARLEMIVKSGWLYKAIAEKDLAAVIQHFIPLMSTVPSHQMPSPLFSAVETGDLMIVEYLAERIEVTAERDANYSNYTILHYAARHNVTVMEALLANVSKHTLAAIIDLTDANKQTPLHVASKSKNYDVVQVLCANGACYNLLNNKNEAPASLCEGYESLKSFFKVLENVFYYARRGDFKEINRACQVSGHNGRALMNAKDGTGWSARKILIEKIKGQ